MNYLVKRSTSFFDGHGCPDDGATTLEISSDTKYAQFIKGEWYVEDNDSEIGYKILDEDTDDHDEYYAQDGYNCKVKYIRVKELDWLELHDAETTLKAYKKLMGSL